jgi:hypothetical protein
MTIAAHYFPDDNASYLLVGTQASASISPALKGVVISRIQPPNLFLLEHRGRCICVAEIWINRVGIRRLDRKAMAWRRFLRRAARHNSKVCWADKPGAFSGGVR